MAWKGHQFGNKKRRKEIDRRWRRGNKQKLNLIGKRKPVKKEKPSVPKPKSDSRVAMLAEAVKVPVPVATAAVQPPQPQKDRLPDGSEFHARWDAKAKRWAGVLDIPLDPANTELTKRFEAESGALTKLCYKLDDRYRAFLDAVSKAAGESVLPGA